MDELFALIKVKSKYVDWGWMFFPAHKLDIPMFLHCTDCGMQYITRGGCMKEEFIEITLEIMKAHGMNPQFVSENFADWDWPNLDEAREQKELLEQQLQKEMERKKEEKKEDNDG